MAGTYQFNMHVRAEGTDNGSIYIRKNGKRIGSSWIEGIKGEKSWGNMASCSVVIELVTGDKVTVTGETVNQGNISGNKRGFSGFLIYPA